MVKKLAECLFPSTPAYERRWAESSSRFALCHWICAALACHIKKMCLQVLTPDLNAEASLQAEQSCHSDVLGLISADECLCRPHKEATCKLLQPCEAL